MIILISGGKEITTGDCSVPDYCGEMLGPEIQADSDWFRITFHREKDGSENTAALILARLAKTPATTVSELAAALDLSTRAVEKQIADSRNQAVLSGCAPARKDIDK